MAAVMGRGAAAWTAPIALALCGALFTSLPLLGPWAADGATVEPPRVSIGELEREPQQYDKRRVLISGLVRSIEFQRGRRGSEYLLLMLEEIHGASPELPPSVKVVTHELTRVKVGEQILVRGVYHIEGHQGGHAYERFIDAEEIRRESAI